MCRRQATLRRKEGRRIVEARPIEVRSKQSVQLGRICLAIEQRADSESPTTTKWSVFVLLCESGCTAVDVADSAGASFHQYDAPTDNARPIMVGEEMAPDAVERERYLPESLELSTPYHGESQDSARLKGQIHHSKKRTGGVICLRCRYQAAKGMEQDVKPQASWARSGPDGCT